MTHTIGYFTGYNPQSLTPSILDRIQQEWGSQLQHMTYEQKIVFRAALAGYIAEKPVWQTEGSGITCIDACIEGAGADWDIWNADELLAQVIQECSQLDESDIEGLIEALSAQIRDRVYASRSV
ncbi:MAG: hypothetical protein AB1861_18125 [Cyanobacteriota bacterium]